MSWGCWLAVLVVLRAALVLAVADVSFWGEELSRGTAAKALIDGVPIPLHQLLYNEFEGGSLVAELLCVPAFLLLGQNLLAHKLVALLWTLAIFLAGMALCSRFLGRRALHGFALLFVLAPGSFQKLSLLNLGSHFGALLFLVGGLYFLMALVTSERLRARDAAGLGLCAGLGCSYSFQAAVFAAFALAVLCFSRREALRLRSGWAGLALGFAPLAWMVSRIGWRVFDVHGPRAEATASLSAFARLDEFLHSVFAGRGWLDVLSIAALGLLVALAAWSTRSGAEQDDSRRATRILLAYLVLFGLVYGFSEYAQGTIVHWFQFNRLSPLWMVATLLAAAACERAWTQPKVRIASLLLLFAAAMGGARDGLQTRAGGLATGWRDGFARSAGLSGVTYFGFFNHLREKRALAPADEARLWFGFDEPARAWLEASATAALFHDPQTGFAEGTQFVAEFAPEGWRGLGLAWVRSHGGDARAALLGALDAPLERRAALLEAIGRAVPKPQRMAAMLRELREQSSGRPEQDVCLDALAFGLGYKLFEFPGEEQRRYFERRETAWCLNDAAFRRWCSEFDTTARDREKLLAGYAQAQNERIGTRITRR